MKNTISIFLLLISLSLFAKERSIKDFGADGKGDAIKDKQAFLAAVKEGPGTILFPAGVYKLSSVTIPAKVTLRGEGKATVIQGSGKGAIFIQHKTNSWRLEKLVLQGTSKKANKDLKEQALVISSSNDFAVIDVEARMFAGKAIEVKFANFSHYVDAGSFARVYANRNYCGMSFGDRAEYMTVSQVNCSLNMIGIEVRGGNMAITGSHFNNNQTGILLEDGPNGSHGSFSNCLINHNHRYAIIAKNVNNAHIFTGCSVFFGAIYMENAHGVVFNAGNIAAPIEVKGARSRVQFTNNFIHSRRVKLKVDDKTSLKNNFDGNGAWPIVEKK